MNVCLNQKQESLATKKRKKSFFEIRDLQPAASEPNKMLYSLRRRPSAFVVTKNEDNGNENNNNTG